MHGTRKMPSDDVALIELNPELAALSERLGPASFRMRMYLQKHHSHEVFGSGRKLFHIENVEWLHVFLYYCLKALGLYGWGNRNFKNLRIRRNTVVLDDLPESFAGYTILQLTDLHSDLDPSLIDVVIEKITPLHYDLCVLTGDFRAHTAGDYEPALLHTARLIPSLKAPIYAVLGNHDFIEMVPPLERLGVRFLLNDNVVLERGGEKLYVAGIDDPHLYENENLERAFQGIPIDAASILLAHSPEVYLKAAACGFKLMLSGHTHGGQICLPGGIALARNEKNPRALDSGPWRHGPLQGYTSAGTGACGIPVRFFCPPEITLHELQRRERP